MTMFAYVQFVKDKLKEIVPIEDVKEFRPNHKEDFVPSVPRMVRWRGRTVDSQGKMSDTTGYHRAYILRLGESREALRKSIEEKRPRIPFRKEDQEESTVDEETEFEESMLDEENQEPDVLGLINQHKQLVGRKRNILEAGPDASSQDDASSADPPLQPLQPGSGDGTRQKTKNKRLRAERDSLVKERDALKQENETLKRLNVALQLKVENLEKGRMPSLRMCHAPDWLIPIPVPVPARCRSVIRAAAFGARRDRRARHLAPG